MAESVFRIMKSGFEAKARGFWVASFICTGISSQKKDPFRCNRTRECPPFPSLSKEETKAVTSKHQI